MLFSSIEFIFLFLPCFFIVYYLLKKTSHRNIFLLLASLFFYAWGEHGYVFLMMFFIALNYLMAVIIDRGWHPRAVLAFTVAANLLLIGFYKYADFFIGTFNSLFATSFPLPHIPLPLGISFFTFQTMSYVIDVYRGDTKVQKNILYLGEYVSSFPQLVAGPIVRYRTVAEEIGERGASLGDMAYGLRRFIFGLAKKVIIANNVAALCDTIFKGTPQEYGAVGAWAGMLAYTMQIYFDFSGYSDMAIGMGRMMGFHFLENFNYPYVARSITDFWRRWHISLSTFFRDYLYIPLGGNRVKKGRWIFNLLVVWLLTGLWHGASWNFVAWGVYYGIILVVEKLLIGKYLEKCGRVVQHVYTMFLVIVGWVIFRMESMGSILDVLSSMFGRNGAGSVSFFVSSQALQGKYALALLLAVLFCTPALTKTLFRKAETSVTAKVCLNAATVALLLISVLLLVSSSYNPFIYFRF